MLVLEQIAKIRMNHISCLPWRNHSHEKCAKLCFIRKKLYESKKHNTMIQIMRTNIYISKFLVHLTILLCLKHRLKVEIFLLKEMRV